MAKILPGYTNNTELACSDGSVDDEVGCFDGSDDTEFASSDGSDDSEVVVSYLVMAV